MANERSEAMEARMYESLVQLMLQMQMQMQKQMQQLAAEDLQMQEERPSLAPSPTSGQRARESWQRPKAEEAPRER